MRVLLVEDNEGDRQLIERSLRCAAPDIEIAVARDGSDAMSLLRAERGAKRARKTDFLLLDLKMPKRGGLDVLAELKCDRELRRIPVIVLTSSNSRSDVASAYDHMANAYFTKPVSDFDPLIAQILGFIASAELPGEDAPAPTGELPTAADQNMSSDPFRLVVESSPNGMVMVNGAGRIVLVNSEAERMFGYARGELIDKPIEKLVPKRFRADHRTHRRAFQRRSVKRAMGAGRDLYAVRRDGSEFPVEIGLNPIHTQDGLFVLSAVVDITERKLAEQALADRTRDLARSNAELEQFAYVASHDLQEPLRMVASFARLLKLDYGDVLGETGRQYAEFALDGAVRMQQLIRDLLAYAQLTGPTTDPDPVPLEKVVETAVQNLSLAVAESGATVDWGSLPTLPVVESQLVDVFQNLIGNGIKFRGNARPHIQIRADRETDAWLFAVQDNGIGISTEYTQAVFEVFKRVDPHAEQSGTGIGLAICKRIVEYHRGEIWVESALGRGSTFFFRLPAPRTTAA